MSDTAKVVGPLAVGAIVKALKDCPAEHYQELIAQIATTAICMLHGTYGKEYTREYLAGAVAELDLPDPMTIKLEVREGRGTIQ